MNQSKYAGKPFDKVLETSQEFVNKIVEYFKLTNNSTLIIRPQDDRHPFTFFDGSQVRGPDIFISMNNKSAFIEAKDFGKFIKYSCTGLPMSTYKKYKQFKECFNLPLILLFRDNPEVEVRTPSEFKKNNIYIPYGGEIDSLKIDNSLSNSPYFKTHFTNEVQMIWKIKSMHPLDYIIRNWEIVLSPPKPPEQLILFNIKDMENDKRYESNDLLYYKRNHG